MLATAHQRGKEGGAASRGLFAHNNKGRAAESPADKLEL